ncbi:hypothetical protein [Tropicibacter oceani]|uniref:DUF3887 domain-containing protein n=1 Tax=Tropicibacter oceani TaxID=3058420 RepID=A0ABY8QE36_9RHOB|nr:hypothetical protein [Tropicibacter oceani]WGW02887.1 hypothetical protein QF118_13185 [Tropicibacter oceani]
MRFLLPLLLILAGAVGAQTRDSVFDSYDAYEAYVDEKIMSRDFIPLVKTLGGRDEYTEAQLSQVNTQLMAAFPVDFENVTRFRQTDLGGGVRQEGRLYWNGESYAFYYAILHERGDQIVVLNFNLNSSISTIMAQF